MPPPPPPALLNVLAPVYFFATRILLTLPLSLRLPYSLLLLLFLVSLSLSSAVAFVLTLPGDAVRTFVFLQAYRTVKGRDFSVPSSFVVPSFLPWPQSCWGLRLGTALVDIRSKGR